MSSFPTCQVCHQQFSLKGPAPFLLPCLHSVCETCVTSAAGGVISCSPCQRDVNLTETPLQKDVVREKGILHLTVKHHPELVLCTNDDDGNQAMCWCKECKDFFCENCQLVHCGLKGTRKHVVQDVKEMELGHLDDVKFCTVHPRYVLDTWDESCCSLICGKCKVAEHVEHKTVDLEEAATTARQLSVSYQKEARTAADQHEARLTVTKQDLRSSDELCNILTGSIGNTFSTLKVLLDQKEKELQIKLQNHKEKVGEYLNRKKNTSETCFHRCETVYDYTEKALQCLSLHDILEMRPMLEKNSQDCRSSAPSGDYKVLPRPVFNSEGLEKIKSTLAQFGDVTTEGVLMTSTKGNLTEKSGTQTEEDVVEELGNIQQELKQMKASEIKLISQTKDLGSQIEKLKQDLKVSKMSEERLNRQKKEAEKNFGAQIERIKQELNASKASEERLDRQNKAAVKNFASEIEKFKQDLEVSKASEERHCRERKEAEKDFGGQIEKMKQDLKESKASEEKLARREKEAEQNYDSQIETMKQELKSSQASKQRLGRQKRKAEKNLGAQIETLKQDLKDSKTSEERLGREKKEAKKEFELREEKLKQEVKHLKASQDRLFSQEGEVERVSGLYRLRKDDLEQSFLLNCTHVKFSKKKYNAKKVHIDADGKLINKAEDNPPYSDQRLEKYEGTSSTAPLPQCGSPQYFEVKSRVGIDKTLTGRNLLLEIGLVREEEQDQHHYIHGRPHSYSLTVSHCTKHSSICRVVWRHGKYITCLPDTLENTPGTSATLHYGVVYDSARSRIAFLNVENEEIIGKIDNVDSSVALWPMFGVYNSSVATVSMSLVVGSDITMSESKKTLIINSLS